MNQSELDSSELLTNFVNTYNVEQQENEETVRLLAIANLTINTQKQKINTLSEKNNEQAADLIEAAKGIAAGEKIEKLYQNQRAEMLLLRKQLSTTQQELTAANNNGSVKKQREQIKRVKAASDLKDKRLNTLSNKVNDLIRDLKQANDDKAACKQVVEMLKSEQGVNQAQGLYHNGDHHLVIWPQKSEMVRPDGSTFQGTNLLYLHQSGRAGFVTFDPQSDESQLCPAPKGGLRLSNEAKAFAHNWLYKVNQLQKGVIEDSDRTPIDYNK